MTRETAKGRPTDAELVAYLDGELEADQRAWVANWLAQDGELRNRLLLLESGARSFREAFEPLLAQAPRRRLADMLAALPTPRPTARVPSWIGGNWPRPGLLAAGIALFVAGIASDHVFPQLREALGITSESEDEDDWRQTVAEYVALYTPETFVGLPEEAALSERQIAMIGSKLGIPLSLARVSLPGATFKWAQLFEYDGKPLGQLAYLDAHNGALALCIYADSHSDTTSLTEERAGLNVVHWSSHGRAFMLVGHAAMPQLQDLANSLSQRLTL